MLYTYNDCLHEYGGDYQLKKALAEQKLYKIEKGIYSSEKYASDLAVVSLKYPNAVFTDESAYYYHDLTDVIPEMYFLATRRTDSRIRDKRVIQSFVSNEVFDHGIIQMTYNDDTIKIYSRERMLIELMRFRSRYPRDYYKEILLNYRRIIYDLDFWKVEEYAALFAHGDNIMKIIETEVL
ncbi:MAG: hypothetical protein MJ128_04860 [Mogibacterium sp.]|nr:hypothetical protein [Mogibacterium sp.]